jgi:hypothetical protein
MKDLQILRSTATHEPLTQFPHQSVGNRMPGTGSTDRHGIAAVDTFHRLLTTDQRKHCSAPGISALDALSGISKMLH